MEIENYKQTLRSQGAKVSGDAIESLERGWAMMGFRNRKVHYYVVTHIEGVDALISKQGRHRLYESLCGVVSECSDKAPAFEGGDFDRCKSCQKLEQKKMPIRLWRKSIKMSAA